MSIGITLALLAAIGYGTADFVGGAGRPAGTHHVHRLHRSGDRSRGDADGRARLARHADPGPRRVGSARRTRQRGRKHLPAARAVPGPDGGRRPDLGGRRGRAARSWPDSPVAIDRSPWSGSASSSRCRGSGWSRARSRTARSPRPRAVAPSSTACWAASGSACSSWPSARSPSRPAPCPWPSTSSPAPSSPSSSRRCCARTWQPSSRAAGWGITSGLLGVSGSLAFVEASHLADLGVVAVLASLYPAVTVLLARALLSERLGAGQRLGLVFCSAAVGPDRRRLTDPRPTVHRRSPATDSLRRRRTACLDKRLQTTSGRSHPC